MLRKEIKGQQTPVMFGQKLLMAECLDLSINMCAKRTLFVVLVLFFLAVGQGMAAIPVAAIHDSELTRALESMPATNGTPSGAGTTGYQWWLTAFHYFVMPDSAKEALRSDGTQFAVLSDSNIASGQLLDSHGAPVYPILISLASEAIGNNEVAPLTNYVAAGGTLLVGGSAFTRLTNGVSRGDFAIAGAMGIHMANANLENWLSDVTFSKLVDNTLVSHIPGGVLDWNMPVSADEVSWGISPGYQLSQGHLVWQVLPGNTEVIAQGDISPYLLTSPFGKGTFIYIASLEPFLGHGGNAPGMYAYGILRNAIHAAFAQANLPIPKLSPWPFAYDAALEVRHDFENFQDQISSLAVSARFEHTNGALGDYYFCTGTLRVEMTNSPTVVAGLRSAVTNYGATIGPHNGGLPNINNLSLVLSNYDYWHWGTDEAMAAPATNLPTGYSSTTNYAFISVSNSFLDIEGWLAGLTNGLRLTVAPHFNATREPSCQIEQALRVNASGEQQLGCFPSWVLSTSLGTPDMRYPFVSLPTSQSYLVPPKVAQAMESGFYDDTMRQLVDFYYSWGGLINLYSHSSSAGNGLAGTLASDYVTYSMSKPRIWPANAASIYNWWVTRSNASWSATFSTNGNQSTLTFSNITATDARTALEAFVPRPSVSALKVFTNGIQAGATSFRTNGPVIKVLVGTSVTNLQLKYFLNPYVQSNFYTVTQGSVLRVASPGVLTNALSGATGTNPVALLGSGPVDGTLKLTNNGGFSYTPASNFVGMDSFTFLGHDSVSTSALARATLNVVPPGDVFYDNFLRPTNADPLAPWTPVLGAWAITGGQLQGSNPDGGTFSDAYVDGNWINYSVQAQIQILTNGFAGGLDGRINAVNGAKYTVNIYPNGFPGQGSAPLLMLWKFQGWQVIGATPLQQASLPVVGTNWHTLKITFRDNEIQAFFDGTMLIDVVDAGFQGSPPYERGGIGAHFYTYTSYTAVNFSNISVSPLPAPPVAVNDLYDYTPNSALTIPPPGVLANDTGWEGTNLTALPVSGPAHGTLVLTSNGGFTYTPSPKFNGTDSFTYSVFDGTATSGVATVTLANLAFGSLYFDNFSSNTLTSWVVQSGAWGVGGGLLQGGPNAGDSYSFAYLTNTWSDYAVQSQLQFGPYGYGGGLGGRLNPVTGGHYAAWIYPSGNELNLLKFQNWDTYSVLASLSLPFVSTNIHTLKLAFEGAQIAVYYDGAMETNLADASPFLSGGVSVDMYTQVDPYVMSLSDVLVEPLVVADSYFVNVNSKLLASSPGVLGNDTGIYGTNLTALLLSSPTYGTLVLSSNGGFNYIPETNFVGTDQFSYRASDPGTNLGSALVTITVESVHNGPSLPPQTNRTILAAVPLVVTNTAQDTDFPPLDLTYSLINPPSGADINSNGIITWTPPQPLVVNTNSSTNLFITTVIDDGVPPLSATNSFQVVVLQSPAPQISSIRLAGGSAILTWSAIAGQSYILQYKPNLLQSQWSNLSPAVVGTGSTASTTNSFGNAPKGFYRIMLVQ